MNAIIHARDFTITPAIRHWIERQLESALQRFDGEVTGVDVYLSDVNGPRGGDDKKVVMRTRLRGLPPVNVITQCGDLYVAISRSAKRLRRGVSVLLFPEGTRSDDGTLAKYRRGPFLTAIEEGAAVLPMHLTNAHLLLPKGTFSVRPGHVRVSFGDPVSVEGRTKGDARAMAAEVEAWTREQAAKA